VMVNTRWTEQVTRGPRLFTRTRGLERFPVCGRFHDTKLTFPQA